MKMKVGELVRFMQFIARQREESMAGAADGRGGNSGLWQSACSSFSFGTSVGKLRIGNRASCQLGSNFAFSYKRFFASWRIAEKS